jgi:hypothetical protein
MALALFWLCKTIAYVGRMTMPAELCQFVKKYSIQKPKKVV